MTWNRVWVRLTAVLALSVVNPGIAQETQPTTRPAANQATQPATQPSVEDESAAATDARAHNLVEQAVEAVGGGMAALKAKNDVRYKYTQRDLSQNKADVSIEKYLFDGELSRATYLEHDLYVMPDRPGEVVQIYDGENVRVLLDGELVEDPQALQMAEFNRKTNFYWFAMMHKLLDPGLDYQYEGYEEIDGVNYDKVRVTFGEGVGDVQDTYLLYINPETHLVDRFLFTVMDFGMDQPFMMFVEYEEVDGVKLPARRRYAQSNWQGEIVGDKWTEEIMEDIEFGVGLTPRDFELPQE